MAATLSLSARRAALYPVLRPVVTIGGAAAAYGTSELYSSRAPPSPAHKSDSQALSPRMSALVSVAGSAPLFGLSSIALSAVLTRMGGMKWLAQTWEHTAWSVLYAGTGLLAAARPMPEVIEAMDLAPGTGPNNAEALYVTFSRVGIALFSVGALVTTAAERLGSSFGRLAFTPLVVGGVLAALQPEPDRFWPLLAVPCSVVPFLLLSTQPVFTRSLELIAVAMWIGVSMVPSLSELVPGSRVHELPPGVRIAVEHGALAMAVLLLHSHAMRRRPICQY